MNIHQGDCRNVLKEMADDSVDSVVCDPPYELGFMGKKWDSTGIAYDPILWAECLRVLKPGGHLLAFGGSRTYHRLACAIEDTGFVIRDQIMWIYGSGFPKSRNIGKAIDKRAGAERVAIETRTDRRKDGTTYGLGHSGKVTSNEPVTDAAKQWDGWGTALKPAHEPIVFARKPFKGRVEDNVQKHGTGAVNVDGCLVGTSGGHHLTEDPPDTGGDSVNCFGDGLNNVSSAPVKGRGRWPANVIHDGSEEVEAEFAKAGTSKSGKSVNKYHTPSGTGRYHMNDKKGERKSDEKVPGHDDQGTPARFFYCAKASKSERNAGLENLPIKQTTGGGGMNDPHCGSAYGSIKAPGHNHHPTVKPVKLMRYLCRLITPPGGLVLDPFAGSGSTGVAAAQEGFDFVGIEMDSEYAEIARRRIEHAI